MTPARTRAEDETLMNRPPHGFDPLVEDFPAQLGRKEREPVEPARQSSPRRLIAVGSGKGGVGKTLISSSLALVLSEVSKQPVVAVDVDLGGANLHTGLGIRKPAFALNRFVMEGISLKALAEPSGMGELQFVGGASDIIGLAEFKEEDRQRFLHELMTFEDETIILDLGAGSSLFNLDLFCTADQGVVVTTSEPTAVQNVYGFLRAAIYRRIWLLFEGEEALRDMIGDAMNHRDRETDSVPKLVQQVSRYNRSAASRMEEIVGELAIGLVVNMSGAKEGAAVADRLAQVVQRYLGARLDFLGNIDWDNHVRRAICDWRPLVVHHPKAKAARKLEDLALRMASRLKVEPTARLGAAG
jgi:flagellar biosynthesis protein FlhG